MRAHSDRGIDKSGGVDDWGWRGGDFVTEGRRFARLQRRCPSCQRSLAELVINTVMKGTIRYLTEAAGTAFLCLFGFFFSSSKKEQLRKHTKGCCKTGLIFVCRLVS